MNPTTITVKRPLLLFARFVTRESLTRFHCGNGMLWFHRPNQPIICLRRII